MKGLRHFALVGLVAAVVVGGSLVGSAQAQQCLGRLSTFSCVVVGVANATLPACSPATVNFCEGQAGGSIIGGDCQQGFPVNSADVIIGSGSQDLIDGGELDDVICAGGGADVVSGGEGGDSILGENGNDALSGDTGNDQLFGGNGNDIIFGNSGADTINGNGGIDLCIGGLSFDTVPQGCEISIQ